jgi:hypothetical protein
MAAEGTEEEGGEEAESAEAQKGRRRKKHGGCGGQLWRFPLLDVAAEWVVEVRQGPGDALFVPSEWHHTVANVVVVQPPTHRRRSRRGRRSRRQGRGRRGGDNSRPLKQLPPLPLPSDGTPMAPSPSPLAGSVLSVNMNWFNGHNLGYVLRRLRRAAAHRRRWGAPATTAAINALASAAAMATTSTSTSTSTTATPNDSGVSGEEEKAGVAAAKEAAEKAAEEAVQQAGKPPFDAGDFLRLLRFKRAMLLRAESGGNDDGGSGGAKERRSSSSAEWSLAVIDRAVAAIARDPAFNPGVRAEARGVLTLPPAAAIKDNF